MTRFGLVMLVGGLAAAGAIGQPGYGAGGGGYVPLTGGGVAPVPGAGFAPNPYNRQFQPLSPYLNLLRGGNPAVNYFYGVRPGLPGYGQTGGGASAPQFGASQIRGGFLPQASVVGGDPVEFPAGGAEVAGFQSVGIPATFSTGPGQGSRTGRPGFFGAGSRPTQTPYKPPTPRRR